ncbi:DUF2290 domain-containing protein [Citrobacter freundii]|uniref:DUF2290 domain-containing protein n=1 Tax=Citrobacter freundii TaxID=546 RepID=UPI0014961995|nr:DUF2290 domain-containing protein [Citrobacter freundii]MDX7144947.1 DUF2290 domain-containing protein [Citrobacter freundii]
MSSFQDIRAIRKCIDFVEASGLLAEPNERVNLPSNYAPLCRSLAYREYWELHKSNFWFQIKLLDESIFLFEENSFRFIMSPVTVPSMDEYFLSEFGEEWENLSNEEKSNYIDSSSFSESYQNFVVSVSDHKSFTPIRLDQHLSQYNPINHPAHHLHIGYENESRIPVKRILNPLSFTVFIISTFYPSVWREMHDSGYINRESIGEYKNNLQIIHHVHPQYWNDEWEESRFYIY